MEATKTSSWPWKRKASTISDSLQPASAVVDAKLQGTKQSQTEDKEQCLLQQQQQVSSDHAINHTMTTTTGTAAAADLETTKLQILSEQLIVRDELVQQHANVAEDAILGWHKAEREAAGLRQQLEKEIIDKVSLESQVVQLSETMKNLQAQLQRAQHAELTFREAVAAKTQNLEELHKELQTALSEVSSESVRAAKEVDARMRAQATVNVLQATVEVGEREQAKLKHELQAMNGELEKGKEEWEVMRKAMEMRNRADAKRITQLEQECGQLRRRLHQTNSVQDLPRNSVQQQDLADHSMAAHSCPKTPAANNNYKLFYGNCNGNANANGGGGALMLHRHTRSVTDDVYGWYNNNNNSRRSFVAHPTDHLLLFGAATDADDDDDFEDESISAESWASALISELAQLKKKNGGRGQCPPSMASGCPGPDHHDLMEDFEEMEMLASTLPPCSADASSQTAPSSPLLLNNQLGRWGKLPWRTSTSMRDHEEEEERANPKDVCNELSMKLVRTQDELNACKLENLEMKATLAGIERHLLMMLQVAASSSSVAAAAAAAALPQEGGCQAQNHHHHHFLLMIVDRIRAALETMSCCSSTSRPAIQQHPLGTESPEVRDIRAWSPSSSGQSSQSDEDHVHYDSTKQLLNAVHQVVCLFQRLPSLQDCNSSRSYKCRGQQNSEDLRARIRSLMVVCDGFLNEKLELHKFLVETATALQWLVKRIFVSSSSSSDGGAARQIEFGTAPPAGDDDDDDDDDDAPNPPMSSDSTEPPQLAITTNPEQAQTTHEAEQQQQQQQDYCSHHHQNPNVASCQHRLQQTEKEYIDTRLAAITEELQTLKLSILMQSTPSPPPPSQSSDQKPDEGNETMQGSSSQETHDSESKVLDAEEHDFEAALGPRPSDSSTQFGALQMPTVHCCESPLVVGVETTITTGPIEEVEEEETPACLKQQELHEDVIEQEEDHHEDMAAENPDANPCNHTSLGSDEEPNVLNERHLHNEDRNSEPSRSFSHLSPEITVRSSPYDRIASSFSAPASPTALDLLIKSPGKFLRMRSETKATAAAAAGLSFDKQASKLSRFFSRSGN